MRARCNLCGQVVAVSAVEELPPLCPSCDARMLGFRMLTLEKSAPAMAVAPLPVRTTGTTTEILVDAEAHANHGTADQAGARAPDGDKPQVRWEFDPVPRPPNASGPDSPRSADSPVGATRPGSAWEERTGRTRPPRPRDAGPLTPGELAGFTPPWEVRRELGVLRAFALTAVAIRRDPRGFFGAQRADDGSGVGLFAIICWVIGFGLQAFTSLIDVQDPAHQRELFDAIRQFSEVRGVLNPVARPEALGPFSLYFMATVPLWAIAMPYFMAGVYHAMLIWVSGNNRGYGATFRATSYGSLPALLFALPFIGPIIGIVLLVFLQSLALAQIHRTESFRTTVGVAFAWPLGLMMFAALFTQVVALLLMLANQATAGATGGV